jgi:hypothetical protein
MCVGADNDYDAEPDSRSAADVHSHGLQRTGYVSIFMVVTPLFSETETDKAHDMGLPSTP